MAEDGRVETDGQCPDPFADPLLGRRLGVYRIETRLGQGGMGTVYRAIHGELDRSVAIKVLDRAAFGMSAEALAAFHEEALAYSRVRHACVVQIFDSGSTGDIDYLVLEYVDGMTLENILAREGPLDFDRLVAVGEQLASALAAIHAAGLVHRDIKPANIMITREGRLKLMDFGVVRRRTGSGAQRTAGPGGTYRYMAPELLDGVSGDARSDVYQLGVLLYEAMSGERHPGPACDLTGKLRERMFSGDESELRPDVSDGLKELILRCLNTSPALRFQNASGLVREFRRLRRLGAGHVSPSRLAPGPDEFESGGRLRIFTLAVLEWLRNQYRLRPVIMVSALVALAMLLSAVPLYFLIAGGGADDRRQSGDLDRGVESGGGGSSGPAAGGGGGAFDVSVTGGLRGFRVSWELAEPGSCRFRFSYRLGGSEPVFVERAFGRARGREFVPLPGTVPGEPTTVGWKLVRGDERIAGGTVPVGFHPLEISSSKPSAVFRDGAMIYLATDSGRVVVLDFTADDGYKAYPWRVRPEDGFDEFVFGMDGRFLYCALGGGGRSYLAAFPAALFLEGRKVQGNFVEGVANAVPFGDGDAAGVAGHLAMKASFSGRVPGRPVFAGGRCGATVVWMTELAERNRLFVLGTDLATGKTGWIEGLKGSAPLKPVLYGNDLIAGFHRRGRGIVCRIEVGGDEPTWIHRVAGALLGGFVLDEGSGAVLFRTEKHLHCLRLSPRPVTGNRFKAASLGDFRIALPGPAGSPTFRKGVVYLVSVPGGGGTVNLLSLPLRMPGGGRRVFQSTPLPVSVRRNPKLVRESPAPVFFGRDMLVPVADSLLVLGSPGRGPGLPGAVQPHVSRSLGTGTSAGNACVLPVLFTFPGRIFAVHTIGHGRVVVVLDNGSLFTGSLLG